MKKIVVLPVKNEGWILENTLQCFELFADHIIIADQQSTDNTLAICKNFSKVITIENKAPYHTSNIRKLLLDAARNFSGANAIFSFDADELPTSHILTPEFNAALYDLQPGISISMEWIQLWRNPLQYRRDGSVWSNSWKQFGFIDDRKMEYTTIGVINDHTSRVPLESLNKVQRLDFPKILHFQFVHFDRMLAKQRLYRITELLNRKGNRFLLSIKINAMYTPSKDEIGLAVRDVPLEWIKDYATVFKNWESRKNISWFEKEAADKIQAMGAKYFRWIDIWDYSWEKLLPDGKITDPRNVFIKFYHKNIIVLYHYLYLFKKHFKAVKQFLSWRIDD